MAARALLAAGAIAAASAAVSLTIDGQPAVVGDVPFYSNGAYRALVLKSDLVEFHFGAVNNTLYNFYTVGATDVIVNGVSLADPVSGSANDGEQHLSFYVDWNAGKNHDSLLCDTVRVVRLQDDLVEVAFIDSTNTYMRAEHHLILKGDVRGLYGYVVLTMQQDAGLNEVRMNTRWNRCLFNRAFNYERKADQKQPTYAYLFTQTKLGDETWRVDGKPNPTLPCPVDNDGDLPAGDVYSKYIWSLYAHENPFWGHFGTDPATGQLFGAWFTPLGGVTEGTSAANFGVGPNHQDLAIHQDAIILNYFVANHYGVPNLPVSKGQVLFRGPWLTHISALPAGSTEQQLLDDAAAVAGANIAQSMTYLPFIDNQPLYPTTARANVTGRITVTDGRPGADLYVLLSEVVADDVYTIKQPTYFVVSQGAEGSFTLPGIPPGTYSLYVFSKAGSIVDQTRVDGVVVAGPVTDLGEVKVTPSDAGFTHVWQVGTADGKGGEFALGSAARSYTLPNQVPGDLTFTVGSSHEPTDWYYAQTAPGTWTVAFNLPRAYTGTAYLTVSASLTQGSSPTLRVNGGASGITGRMPSGTDSSLSRQAVRSGYAKQATFTFDAGALLRAGDNTITFKRDGSAGASGLGWDTVVLTIDEGGNAAREPPPALNVSAVLAPHANPAGASLPPVVDVTLAVTNTGGRHAMDVRLNRLAWVTVAADGSRLGAAAVPARVAAGSRDPAVFHVPVAAAVGAAVPAARHAITLEHPPADALALLPAGAHLALEVGVSADGGRTRATATVRYL